MMKNMAISINGGDCNTHNHNFITACRMGFYHELVWIGISWANLLNLKILEENIFFGWILEKNKGSGRYEPVYLEAFKEFLQIKFRVLQMLSVRWFLKTIDPSDCWNPKGWRLKNLKIKFKILIFETGLLVCMVHGKVLHQIS